MAIILERNEIISPKSANLWRSTRLQPADRGGADNLCTGSVCDRAKKGVATGHLVAL